MSLLVLAIVFIVAIGAIAFIVLRKTPYLRRLTPEVLEQTDMHQGFFTELFPELTHVINDRVFRSLRSGSLSVSADIAKAVQTLWQALEGLITKGTKALQYRHKSATKDAQTQNRKDASALVSDKIAKGAKSFEEQEQELIVLIAKDPKNAQHYEQLGDLYVEYNHREEAQQSLEQAIALDDSLHSAKTKLDKLLKNSNI